MIIVGFDLGKRKSYVVASRDGVVVLDQPVATRREELDALAQSLGAGCQLLMEAGTSSEWVARVFEAREVNVIVADPNFGPMYARRDKRIKTDRRDAYGLLEALQLGAYRLSQRRSDDEMLTRSQLLLRDRLVRSRTKLINGVHATLQRFGVVEEGTKDFSDATRRVVHQTGLIEIIEPTLRMIDNLTSEIAAVDRALARKVEVTPAARRLDQVVQVGPITALAFACALADAKRFKSAREVTAYLGLVPSERSSGERAGNRGAITKHGDRATRALLVEAATGMMRSKNAKVAPLREWALALAARKGKGGKKLAAVALARRLARIMYAMWRDNSDFEPERIGANRCLQPPPERLRRNDLKRRTTCE
jgi:transposase